MPLIFFALLSLTAHADLRGAWLDKITSPIGLPAALCKKPFLDCYKMEEATCLKEAEAAARECVGKTPIPENLVPEVAGQTALKLGHCMEDKVKGAHAKDKLGDCKKK